MKRPISTGYTAYTSLLISRKNSNLLSEATMIIATASA